jgi:hypothetical protein
MVIFKSRKFDFEVCQMPRILLILLLVGAPSRYVLAQAAQAPPAGDAAATSAAAPAAEGGSAPAATAPQPSAEAVAANKEFEALAEQWKTLIARLKDLQQQRDAASGDARSALEAQMADVRRQTSELIDKIFAAGVKVYKADPQGFPQVNNTLLAIAQFEVIGDAHGDGGDQYEKALPLIKSFIEAGAGATWPNI